MEIAIRRLSLTAIASCVLLTACGGGGGAVAPVPPPPSPVPTGTVTKPATTTAIVTIDGNADTAAAAITRHLSLAKGRKPMYVSPSSMGLTVTVNGGNPQVFDISPGSSLCTSTTPRTCTLSVVAPVGSDSFVLTIYDQAPSGGSIPSGAKTLGISTVNQTITANTANTINFVVGGVVAGVSASGGVTYGSLPADGAAHTYNMAVIVTDADGNTINGSAAYNNPVTVSLAENAGSAHSYLLKNGTNVGTSTTLTSPSDSIALHYDGGGSPGYYTTTAFSDAGASGTTVQVSPMYVTGAFGFTDAGQNKTASVTEANAPANVGYPVSWSCSGFGESMSGSGASGTLSITSPSAVAGSALSSSYSCSNVTVTDNYGSSISVPVSAAIPISNVCSDQSASIYLGNGASPYETSSGTPCALSVGTTSGSIYIGGSPSSFTSSISEANDRAAISLSGCGGIASLSTTSIGGSGSYTGTTSGAVTISSAAAGSCNVTVSDSRGQSSTISVTVTDATFASTSSTQSTSANATWCGTVQTQTHACTPASAKFNIGWNGSGSATAPSFVANTSALAINVTDSSSSANGKGGVTGCVVLEEWPSSSPSSISYYKVASGSVNTVVANPNVGYDAAVYIGIDEGAFTQSIAFNDSVTASGSGTVSASNASGTALTAFTPSGWVDFSHSGTYVCQ